MFYATAAGGSVFARAQLKQFVVTGRHVPTEREPTPPLYKMQIFAPNSVIAKSRYWYFLSQLKKMKKATGQILDVQEVCSIVRQADCSVHPVLVTFAGTQLPRAMRKGIPSPLELALGLLRLAPASRWGC